MILSTWCEVWIVAGQVENQSSAADVGGSWLHLVIPMICVFAREAQDAS